MAEMTIERRSGEVRGLRHIVHRRLRIAGEFLGRSLKQCSSMTVRVGAWGRSGVGAHQDAFPRVTQVYRFASTVSASYATHFGRMAAGSASGV